MTRASLVLVVALAAAGCSGPGAAHPSNLPPDVQQACAIAERKCTACHERERWAEAQHSAAEWVDIVDEMRLLPGSGITLPESQEILRCLNARASRGTAAFRSRHLHPVGLCASR